MTTVSVPLRERGRKRHLCGCGQPSIIRVHLEAREKARTGSGQVIHNVYRSLCEECATRLFDYVEEEWPR